MAVLTGSATLALRKQRFFRSFKWVCIGSFTGWLCSAPGLVRYALRGDLRFAGLMRLSDSWLTLPLLLFENRRCGQGANQRLFVPVDMTASERIRLLKPIDYVILRWGDKVEREEHISDLDILIRDDALESTKILLAQCPGTYPVDVYTESGIDGHAFKSAPYYPPKVARRLLAAATTRQSGMKVLEGDLAYLAYAYHLLFHKTARTPEGSEVLAPSFWPPGEALDELRRLARIADLRVPTTFTHLEEDLFAADMMPPLDMIGFYSNRNRFLRRRYMARKAAPGLSVFLVRDFGLQPDPLPEIRQKLCEVGYEIALEGVFGDAPASAFETIRGGNWYDKYAPTRTAPPIYYLVCLNRNPTKPSKRTLARYPLVDDESVMIKRRIRDEFTRRRGATTNIVHASDNAAEAWEYVRSLGLEQTLHALCPTNESKQSDNKSSGVPAEMCAHHEPHRRGPR